MTEPATQPPADDDEAPRVPPEPPGMGALLRWSLLVSGVSLLVILASFWIYQAYAWLFPS